MPTTDDPFDLADTDVGRRILARPTTAIRVFRVGGCVRDEILGVPTKDIDFAVEVATFDELRAFVVGEGFKVHTEKPEHQTIRCGIPKGHPLAAIAKDADFVQTRTDGTYSDGRRPDSVAPGSIWDDLARRDFTVNAMAIGEDGVLLDPHDGQADLASMTLRFVGDPMARITEDSLRVLRAVRFVITKGFRLAATTAHALRAPEVPGLLDRLPSERIREELERAFRADTIGTVRLLDRLNLFDPIFMRDDLRLKPTMED